MHKTFLLQNVNTKEYFTRTSSKDFKEYIGTDTSISFGKETYYVIQEITEI